MMNIKLCELSYPWKKYNFFEKKNIEFFIAGWMNKKDLINLKKSFAMGHYNLIRWLKNYNRQFGLIIREKHRIVLVSDKISSFPIFFCDHKNKIEISNSTNIWINHDLKNDLNLDKIKLYQMAGYTIGRSTMRNSVKKVLPGEIVIFQNKNQSPKIKRYFKFLPNFSNKENIRDKSYLIEKLDHVLNKAIKRLIDQANGKYIVLSLSSGYDSRLILGKLLEFNYDKIYCFSYGSKNNFDAIEAERITKKLQVKFTFIEDLKSKNKQLKLKNGKLKKYFHNSSGLNTTASMTEFIYLDELLKKKPFLKKGVFTNGQTGDFISGGHIPTANIDTFFSLLKLIQNKHFCLIRNFTLDDKELKSTFDNWLKDSNFNFSKINFYAIWQLFEWQERQSNYIVNQVRAYDYLNLEWSLPLWDGELMDFFNKVPLEFQFNQNLYIEYLKKWNFKNIFNPLRVNANPWSKKGHFIIGMAQVIKIFFGNDYKLKFYKLMDYYSTNNFQYSFFPFSEYKKNYFQIKNAVTLFTQLNYKYIRKFSENSPKTLLD